MSDNKNLETLRKIYARYERGSTPAERLTAEKLFKKLSAKYGISLDELVQTTSLVKYDCRFYDRMELQILAGAAAAVLGMEEYTYNAKRKRIYVECTPVQWVEFKEYGDQLLASFRAEMKALKKSAMYGFMLKNNLIGTSNDSNDENAVKMSAKEIADIRMMEGRMDQVQRKTNHKRLYNDNKVL